MTEPDRAIPSATIVIAWAPAAADALALALPEPTDPTIVILPSSLSRRDPLTTFVRARLRSRGIATHVLIPANPVAAMTPFGKGRNSAGWRSMVITPPDRLPYRIGLLGGMVEAAPLWTVTDVDAVAGRGPYVLDLVARYAHPADRLRLLATRQRADMAAEMNLVATPALCIAGHRLGDGDGYLVTITSDPIAGELVALAQADRQLARGGELTGPWEERVVQRATELELGIQVPDQLTVTIVGSPDRETRATIRRIASRIGVILS